MVQSGAVLGISDRVPPIASANSGHSASARVDSRRRDRTGLGTIANGLGCGIVITVLVALRLTRVQAEEVSGRPHVTNLVADSFEYIVDTVQLERPDIITSPLSITRQPVVLHKAHENEPHRWRIFPMTVPTTGLSSRRESPPIGMTFEYRW